ncbi:PIN domain-containing protein [Nocardioides sp. AE5]|uniref:type II toxin-antitoxin system VapC family toxin n=1 Tax=Nocardioides sp. AE5 TaxID=2962573 RepID=UPI002882774C|nr:PIN domain-containing protein [Nocardioides sp. AE5]MDT0203301.1 PIN domain-containing protein [Nocardioides sp. AE5]
MTTSADLLALVVVDTNVLLAATDRSRAAHQAATDFLNEDLRRLALTPQIAREYLAVSTRPIEANGFGLSGKDAADNLEQFLDDMELLAEGISTTRQLIELIGDRSAAGKQVHDANVVAVALAHQAKAIVTDNTRHFARFAPLIAVENLGAPA